MMHNIRKTSFYREHESMILATIQRKLIRIVHSPSVYSCHLAHMQVKINIEV